MNVVRRFIHGIALSMLAIVVAGTVGCGHKQTTAPAPTDSAAAPRPRVVAAKPLRKPIRRATTQPGQIEPFEQARLYAKVAGYVEKYMVDIGDAVQGPRYDENGRLVKRGQLLAELSAPEMEQALAEKRALVAQSGANVEQAQAAIKVAQADAVSADARLREAVASADRYEAEYQRWASEYDRVAQLVAKSVVTQKLADETKSQMLAADAARKEVEAKIDSARSLVAASQAHVAKAMADEAAIRAARDVAEAEEAHAAALLDYLKIEAPFDGTISQRNADTGFFAQAGGGDQAQPLFTVVRTDRVRVFANLPEMEAPLAGAGDRAVVRVQSMPGDDFPGTVTRTAWALDPTTRTLRTEVDVPNPDGKLRPGMYAQVTIDLAEQPDALVVPATAVVVQEHRLWCFAVVDSKAIRKPVKLGLKSGAEVEIVSGLDGNELVVQEKGASLTEGQAVELLDAVPGK